MASAKAYTAVSFRTNTTELAEATQPGRPQSGIRNRPGVAAVGGGLMIQAGGSLRLTAMPVSALPKKQSLSLAEARSALQQDSFAGDDEEIPTTALRPEETAVFEAGERDPRECWVVLEVDPSGIVTAELGAHAVTVS